jgi:twitching motility protein PilT
VDAGLTVNRILGMFSLEEERQIRLRLSDTLRWVACQRLLPNKAGGRVAAFEIMGANLRVKESILNGESEGKTCYESIEGSRPFGMMTFDQSISDLYAREIISEEIAMRYASKKSVVGRALDQIKSARGQKTTTIEGLSLDDEYGKRGEMKR